MASGNDASSSGTSWRVQAVAWSTWMGSAHFQTRRLPHVATEMSLHVLAYNLKRVMSILGTAKTMKAMAMMARERLVMRLLRHWRALVSSDWHIALHRPLWIVGAPRAVTQPWRGQPRPPDDVLTQPRLIAVVQTLKL
jgi:hypothetical protein